MTCSAVPIECQSALSWADLLPSRMIHTYFGVHELLFPGKVPGFYQTDTFMHGNNNPWLYFTDTCCLSVILDTKNLACEIIYKRCLIIIIKSEVWTIIHYLGLGHETMVYSNELLQDGKLKKKTKKKRNFSSPQLLRPLYYHGLTLVPAWINNNMPGSVGWDYLSIPILQRLHRWSMGMEM